MLHLESVTHPQCSSLVEGFMHYPCTTEATCKVMNDLCPIAPTSSVMKMFERVVLLRFQKIVTDFVDPLQFTYREARSVDDAILYVLDNVYSHLDKPATSSCLMFYNFSGAFNTIQPHLLAEKLLTMNVHPAVILWVLDYLTTGS